MMELRKRKFLLCLLVVGVMMVFAACSGTAEADPGDEENEAADLETVRYEVEGVAGTDSFALVDVILSSFSTRQFLAEEVSSADLELILKSGIQAASARNLQPWHFTVVTDYEVASQFAQVEEGMAAIVIFGVTEKTEGVNVDFDCGLAVSNMYNAAQALGLGAHIYTSPVDRINESMLDTLEVPDGYEAVSVMTIGHIADREDAVSSATTRNDFDDVVNFIQ